MRIQKRYIVLLLALSLFLIITSVNSVNVSAAVDCSLYGYNAYDCTTPVTWTCADIAACNGVVASPAGSTQCVASWMDACANIGCGCAAGETPKTYYNDSDGDTYGDPSVTYTGCNPPSSYVLDNTDCNDNNAAVWQLASYYPDIDGDTYGCDPIESVCSGNGPPTGYSTTNTDCDCNNPNCNTDCSSIVYQDYDLDGYGNPAIFSPICSAPPGYVSDNTDCDDSSPSCNTDCTTLAYLDFDGDGYGNPAVSARACDAPSIYVLDNTDCDDSNINIWQLASYYPDIDGDTYGCDPIESVCSGNGPPTGYSTTNTDCDCSNPNKWQLGFAYYDADGDTYGCGSLTGACYGANFPPENYTLTPNDCDCNVFSCNTDCSTLSYLDSDQDTYCDNPAVSARACDAPPLYTVSNPSLCTDCSNNDPSTWRLGDFYVDADGDGYGVNPLITDICYGATSPPTGYSSIIVDCDDSVPSCNTDCTTLAYLDSDGDGYGDPSVSARACDAPANYVLDNTDCDDSVASCNTDCVTLAYNDSDGDGFCNYPLDSHRKCDAPNPPYSVFDPALCTDCSNNDPNTYREGDFCANNDGDAYGIPPQTTVCYGSQDPPSGYSYSCIDCDDTVPNTWSVGNFVVKYQGSTVAAIDNYGVLAIKGGIFNQNPITGIPPSFTIKDSSSNIVSAITNTGDIYSILGITNMFNNPITPTTNKDLLIRYKGQNMALFTETGEVKVRCVMDNFNFLGTPLG